MDSKRKSYTSEYKLKVVLGTGKNRVKRVMKKYGIEARRKKKRYVYPGKANSMAPNLLRA